MTSSDSQAWTGSLAPIDLLRWAAPASALIAIPASGWFAQPPEPSGTFFFNQDRPVLFAMAAAVLIYQWLGLGKRWQNEIELSPKKCLIGGALVFAITLAGHWLVMFGYDLSRDESMASFAAQQIARGEVVTPVPADWRPFGHAMLPLYFYDRLSPDVVWTSAYLPINSAIRALAGAVIDPAVANPLLLVAGLVALWKVARSLWPDRRDVAVVAVLLAATSSQLIVTAMTSYAMTGHFALNMIWLACVLRGGKGGVAGALLVAFLAMGLHQFHFHLLFAAPFVVWLAARRQWRVAAVYGLAYAAMTLYWHSGYTAWLIAQADPAALLKLHHSTWDYAGSRLGRMRKYSPVVWVLNLARFVAWQNLLLLPLIVSALPILKTKAGRQLGPIVPLAVICALGLVLLVYQGLGWGYRYLDADLGGFCLLAGYGWTRAVPRPGPGPAWSALKCACCFAVLGTLPVQLAMARSWVAPAARLYRAAEAAPADVVLIDISRGAYAQDIVQNPPNFRRSPKLMDLSFVPTDALAWLCRTKRVSRIDRRHYRAVGLRDTPIIPETEQRLEVRRALLARLNCAPPIALSATS